MVTDRGAHAGEHGLQACGGVGVCVADDLSGTVTSIRHQTLWQRNEILMLCFSGVPARPRLTHKCDSVDDDHYAQKRQPGRESSLPN